MSQKTHWAVKRAFLLGSLFVLNCLLGGILVWRLEKSPVVARSESSAAPVRPDSVEARSPVAASTPKPSPVTPFAAVYSSKPGEFVNNLRRVGCPEETIKDILVAEVSRRYRSQEAELRPKPADHVPFTWSPKTSEARLLERRQQAAAIAREKEATLRSALGYDVHVEMPLYSMTMSDLGFSQTINSISSTDRQAAYQAQEEYWLGVEQLRGRTRGFWGPADVEELDQLKKTRRDRLESLSKAQP